MELDKLPVGSKIEAVVLDSRGPKTVIATKFDGGWFDPKGHCFFVGNTLNKTVTGEVRFNGCSEYWIYKRVIYNPAELIHHLKMPEKKRNVSWGDFFYKLAVLLFMLGTLVIAIRFLLLIDTSTIKF